MKDAMRIAARRSYFSELVQTLNDFKVSIEKFPLAFNLATQDILTRYRGSVLGPWWITIVTASLVLGIGYTYAASFNTQVSVLMPYVAVGIVTWGFISASISEGCDSFVAGAAILRQSNLPLPIFIIRTMVRNIINLAHQLVIIFGVLIYFRVFNGPAMLWSVLGFLLIVANVGWISLSTALVSARFRDVPQIVSAVLQFLFFLTPVFWIPSAAQLTSTAVRLNPFHMAIQSVRAPLLAGVAPLNDYVVLAGVALAGWLVSLAWYNQTRRRVVHYL